MIFQEVVFDLSRMRQNCSQAVDVPDWTTRRRPLRGFAAGDCLQDAEDGIAAGEGDEGEETVGAVFADGFDEEGDGAEEGQGGGPGIAPGAVGTRSVGIADAEEEEGDEREHVVVTKKKASMAITRSNLPMAKMTPTRALRKRATVGVPPLFTRVT